MWPVVRPSACGPRQHDFLRRCAFSCAFYVCNRQQTWNFNAISDPFVRSPCTVSYGAPAPAAAADAHSSTSSAAAWRWLHVAACSASPACLLTAHCTPPHTCLRRRHLQHKRVMAQPGVLPRRLPCKPADQTRAAGLSLWWMIPGPRAGALGPPPDARGTCCT
jgi:hypothetical protein